MHLNGIISCMVYSKREKIRVTFKSLAKTRVLGFGLRQV